MFKTIVSILLLLVLLQGSLYAQPFFVWPGDANGNGVVNHVDLLELGLHYGHQGPARAFSSSSWFPHVLDTAWGIYSPSLVDLGHGDCNGDGQIDSLDAAVVGQNFGNYWQLANPGDGSTLDTLAAPSLQLNAPNPISLTQLDTVSVPCHWATDPKLTANSMVWPSPSILIRRLSIRFSWRFQGAG
jgi:hypothetical protein